MMYWKFSLLNIVVPDLPDVIPNPVEVEAQDIVLKEEDKEPDKEELVHELGNEKEELEKPKV